MAVVHIITSTDIGGAEGALRRYLDSTRGGEQKLYVLSLKNIGSVGREIEALGIEVFPLKLDTFFGVVLLVPKLVFFVLSKRPVVIISWLYHAMLMGLVISKIFGIRHVANIRSSACDYKDWPLQRRVVFKLLQLFCPSQTVVVFNSHRSLEKHRQLRFRFDNACIIYNAWGPDPMVRDHLSLGDSLSIPPKKFIVGFVGRNSSVKRSVDFLLFGQVLKNMGVPIHLLIAGRGYGEKFLRLSDSLGLGSDVTIVGEVSDPGLCYNVMDLLCLCSVSEGFPNVILEAVKHQVPVISTDVSDLKLFFLQDWQVVRVGDVNGLAIAACKVFKMQETELRALTDFQAKKFKLHCDSTKIHKKMEKVFHGT